MGPKEKIGSCKKTSGGVKVTSVAHGPSNENDLAAAVASHGPFSIRVAADSWQHWGDNNCNVMVSGCTGRIDHDVAIVGFHKTAKDKSGKPLPYWIVRNSWGKKWGCKGYIYLKMGLDMCQLTNEPAIPKVSSANDEITV